MEHVIQIWRNNDIKGLSPLRSVLDMFLRITNKSSTLNLLPFVITASHFYILILYNHNNFAKQTMDGSLNLNYDICQTLLWVRYINKFLFWNYLKTTKATGSTSLFSRKVYSLFWKIAWFLCHHSQMLQGCLSFFFVFFVFFLYIKILI